MGRLDGRVAAVTGGASGIGEAIVRLFAEEGARVGFADLDGDRGDAVEEEVRARGGEALFVPTRVERESEAAGFIERTAAHFGRLDILVNNAGMRLYQDVTQASEASWDQIWGVNVKGYAFCAKAAILLMRRQGAGSVVNVASNSAFIASANAALYDTTKAAVTGLTRAMARDHAEQGIRVNALCPGPTLTPFHQRRAAAAGMALEAFAEEVGQPTMLKRPAAPREIAACALFLASEEASYVTGSCLVADGGESTSGSNRPMQAASDGA